MSIAGRAPNHDELKVAIKRANRITEARLLVKRAERLCKMRPYPSEERQLIRDMRLALEGLLDEVPS